MKSYIDYFEPGGNVRYMKRLLPWKPKEEVPAPDNVTGSYTFWGIRKLLEKYGRKEADVKAPEVATAPTSQRGSKYVVNLHPSIEHPTDTFTIGGTTYIVNNQFGS